MSHTPPRPRGRWTQIQDGTQGPEKGSGVLPVLCCLNVPPLRPSIGSCLPPAVLPSISLCVQCHTLEPCLLMFFSVFSSLQLEVAIMAQTLHMCFSYASLQACFHWFRADPFHIHYFHLLRVRESGLLKFMGWAKSTDRLFSDEVPTFPPPKASMFISLLLFLYDLRWLVSSSFVSITVIPMQKPRLHRLDVNWPKASLWDWTFRIKIKMFLDLSSSRNRGHPLRDLQAPDLPNTAGCPRAPAERRAWGRGAVRGGQLPVGEALGRCSDWPA